MDAYALGQQLVKEALQAFRPGLLTRLLSSAPGTIERSRNNRHALRQALKNLGLLERQVPSGTFQRAHEAIVRQLTENRSRAQEAVRQLRGA